MSIWFASLLIVASGTALLKLFIRPLFAVILAGLRAAIFAIHHGFGVGQSWRLLDDLTYLDQGQILAHSSYSSWDIVASLEGREFAIGTAASRHYVYGLVNSVAIDAANTDAYWAPVALNVIFSMATSVVLFFIMKQLGLRPRIATAIAAFYAIHPEVIGWSTFVNLKDTLVGLLIVLTFYLLIKFYASDSRWMPPIAFASLLAVYFIWTGLRLYIPFLVIASLVIGHSQSLRRPWSIIATPIAICGAYVGAILFLSREGFYETLGPMAFWGIVRGLVTPRPWAIDEAYSFLTVPAVFHWILLPFLVLGLIALYRLPFWGPTLLSFVGLILLIGAVIPDVQGPRQRFQIQSVLLGCQVVGVYMASTVHRGYFRHPRTLFTSWSGMGHLPELSSADGFSRVSAMKR